jgi:ATP-dependent Lhr-like helicase
MQPGIVCNDDLQVLSLLTNRVVELIKERNLIPLSDVQKLAIPQILSGENVLVISPTGTGKTEAAILPIFDTLIKSGLKNEPGFKILYITPLRALNRDMLERLMWWASKLDIKIAVRHGDTSKRERSLQSMYPPDLIVTTPETFQILLVGKKLSKYLKTVKWVVVDEVHELAQDKRGSQLTLGLERLRLLTESEPQIVGLSATVGDPNVLSRFLFGTNRNYKVVDASPEKWIEIDVVLPRPSENEIELARENLEHPEVLARLNVISEVLLSNNSTLIFTNTRETAEALANKLTLYKSDIATAVHHGSLGVAIRATAEKWLKTGEVKGVVATSSLELGIDVGNVNFVIQYGSPRQAIHLIQRVGRSGHTIQGVSKGLIVTIDEEDAIESIVIRKRALEKKLEELSIIEKPLDVLAHQITGFLLYKPSWGLDELLEIIKNAFPYRALSLEELDFLVSFLVNRYPSLLVYDKEKGMIRRGKSNFYTYKFYYDHISTIPEIKQFKVVDSRTNEIIGTLDEEFVAEKGLPGTKFIMGGRVWVFNEAKEDSISVTSSEDPTGAVPFWVGEEIPVVFQVAREVGLFRRKVLEQLKSGLSLEEVASYFSKLFLIKKDVIKDAIHPIYESYKEGFPVATDEEVVIENWKGTTIIHACNGNQVNSALAKVLSSLILEREEAIVSSNDPYRVIINYDLDPKFVLDLMKKVNDKNLIDSLTSGIESIGLFKRRLIHVGRRFGVIEKDVSLTSPELNTLMNLLKGTPVFEEAKNELFTKDYDVKDLKLFLEEIKSGKLKVSFIEKRDVPSPLAYIGLHSAERKSEIFPPEKLEKLFRKYSLARLKSSLVSFICLNCFYSFGPIKVSSITFPLNCPKCGSEYVGLVKDEDEANWIKYHSDSAKAKKIMEKAKRTALLLYRYKNLAALVLASNVSLREAETILTKFNSEEEVLSAIIEAEKRRSFVI